MCVCEGAKGFDACVDVVLGHVLRHFGDAVFTGFGILASDAPQSEGHERRWVSAKKFVDVHVDENSSVV